MMLSAWQAVEARTTKDIDFLGKIDNAEESINAAILGILAIPASEDGILFDAAPELLYYSRESAIAE